MTAPGPHRVLVVDAVMKEQRIDISHHHAKGLPAIPLGEVDTIVTLCAEEVCPVVPGNVRRLHWALPDPARATGTDAERLSAFRTTRDALRDLLPTIWEG